MKECKVIGYQECTIKDTHEEMLRICLQIKSSRENYVGDESVYIFLPNEEKLKSDIEKYLNKEYFKCTYETTDNIVTGKTKVSKLIFS